ncbi:MAG TPA: AAA-like domain-containing protein [Chthonomonadaceae bacterium]|nr:AAA-like domain-containing protein [Chthonomonadaceae bacterium]
MSPARLRIELFGGLKLVRQGQRRTPHFETRKVAALLAYLCLPVGRAHPREVLAEQLWPGEDWENTRSRLRQTLSCLRRHLEPSDIPDGSFLVADHFEVWLDPKQVVTDVVDFEAVLRASARAADPSERIRLLQEAVTLYANDLLPGFYEDAILQERERLAETYRGALEQLANALEARGDLPDAIEMARRLVQQDPLREEVHCHLMRLLAASGNTAEVLRQYREMERTLRDDLGIAPSSATRALLAQLQTGPAAAPEQGGASASSPLEPLMARLRLEPEGGAVPLDSHFYVVRPTDAAFQAAIARRDSLVLVKGSRQVGKTSLLARGLQQARDAGASVVMTDLQKLIPEQMETAATLFETFAEMMIEQLDLDLSLESVWNPRRGWNVNFDRFLRRDVLGNLSAPLVWGLDEVDRLFGHDFSPVVFGLFRSWHNERSLNPDGPWGRLTLAIAYATEAHLFITDLNQSPFNVGTRLALEDFTQGEVQELNRRYGFPLSSPQEVERFCGLVGGHPYLVRRGLQSMTVDGFTLDTLEADAGREDGIFGDHLRRLLAALSQDAGLCEAVRTVMKGQACPDAESFYRLRSAGVLVGADLAKARPRCGLYRSFLESRMP